MKVTFGSQVEEKKISPWISQLDFEDVLEETDSEKLQGYLFEYLMSEKADIIYDDVISGLLT